MAEHRKWEQLFFFVVRCEVSHIFEDEDGYVEEKNIPDPNDRKTNQTESFFFTSFRL